MSTRLRRGRFAGAAGPVVVLLAAASLPANLGRAADWLQFRGPGGLGVADASPPLTWGKDKNLAWKAELPGPGTSSPVVAGGRIFLTCYSGFGPGGAGDLDRLRRHVVCLGLDGKQQWEKEVPARLPEQARIREDHGYASSTPAADGERVYVFFGKSGVFAFSHDGRQLWQADVGSDLNGWGTAASPVLFQNLVLVNASVESQSLVALDRETGREVWRVRGVREAWNTPLLVKAGGRDEVVVAVPEKLLAFDPAGGERLWSCDTGIRSYMAPSLVADDGVVYCVGGRTNGSLAVRAGGRGDVTDTHRLWTGRKGSNVSSPVAHDGHLYWMNDNQGTAYCVEGKTGRVVYEARVRGAGQVYASPVVAGGRIYYVGREGRTFVLPARPEYELLAVNDLRDRGTFNASPAVEGNRLLIRSDKVLYCVAGE